MADRENVGALWRALKTSVAEPLAGKAGEMLGKHFLQHPQVVSVLDGFNPDWCELLATGIKAGGGIMEIPGKGSAIYILNEALDSFFGGLGRSVESFKDKSPDDIANDLFVISAIDTAVRRVEELGKMKVKADLAANSFDFDGCARAHGKTMTLGEALQQGFVPKNCVCTGKVWNGFQDALQKQVVAPTKTVNIIQIVRELEQDAVEAEDDVLLGQVAHFRAAVIHLPKTLRIELEQLAVEPGAKENIRALISYDENEWPVVVDYMLKDPKAKAAGTIRSVIEGAGKIGKKIVAKAVVEVGEVGRIIESADVAIRTNTIDLDLQRAEQLRAQAFEKAFRAEENSKRGWFAYVAYGSFFFFVAFTIYMVVAH